MNIALLFIAAIGIPIITVILLIAPSYFAMFGVLYIKYGDKALNIMWDVERVIHSYTTLLNHWLTHSDTLSIVDYALPIVGLPLAGIVTTLFLAWRFVTYVRNIFILTT